MEISAQTPSSGKYGELSQLIGETISSYRLEDPKSLRITCESGRIFALSLEDEGAGGNDSCVSFQSVTLITDHKVTAVRELDSSRDGARFVVECKWRAGVIEVVHESSGWYGWSHSLTEITPAS